MVEREKPNYPTTKQVIERALSSPRMHKLLENKVKLPVGETVIPREQKQEMSQEKKFGEFFKNIRTTAGFSRKKLSKLTGIDPVYIYYLERGKREPSLKVLRRLISSLNLSGENLQELCQLTFYKVPQVETAKETVIFQRQLQEMPPYIIKLPENNPDIPEIVYLGLNNRARNALLRNNITKISVLSSLSDEYLLSEIPWFGPKSLLEIRTKLEEFRQKLIEKQAGNPREPVVVEIPLPKSKKEKREKQGKWFQKWAPLINFIRKWQKEHPGRVGAQSAAAKEFGISRQRVNQISANYYYNELFKPPREGISLSQLAHQLEIKPKVLLNLLRQGKVSLGDEKIDEFYKDANHDSYNLQLRNNLKRIPTSSVDMDKLKDELMKLQITEDLTRSVAQHHKETFIPFLKLARQANMGNPRETSKLYDELTSAGFHLKKVFYKYRYKEGYYYFVHKQEASSLVAYLREKYQAESKVKLIFGPTESYLPTTGEFFQKGCFIPPSGILKESGFKFHPRVILLILEKILGEESPIPVYLYHRKSSVDIKIPKDYVENFRNLVSEKKGEVTALLNKNG